MIGKSYTDWNQSKRLLICFLVLALVITPFLGMGQQVAAQDQESDVPEVLNAASISDLILMVEQLKDDGAFTNAQAFRSLKLHLTAMEHLEAQQGLDKVVTHMPGFHQLLDNQKNQGWISNEGYSLLKEQAEQLLRNALAIPIVMNGQANAVVLTPEDSNATIVEMTDAIVDYVQQSSGAELQVMTVSELEQATELNEYVHIYIAQSHPDDTAYLEAQMEGLDDQGFLIYPQDNRITIVGPSIWGSRNGVYDFLERYVGVRWLMPGTDGDYVPQSSDILVDDELVRDEPHFPHRVISAALHVEGQWWKRMKLQLGDDRPVRFQENLYNLFPVEKYGETNPEFYPGGNPPAPGDRHSWQPCISAEGSAEAAASGIIEFFDNNPQVSSYSLGINDTNNFCEANPNHPLFPDQLNSVGEQELSDLYYAWVNDIVEQVLEVYPDKWFGLLAYKNVSDPPSFQVHERVVPFITKDRLAWIDEDVEAYYHQQMDAWNAVSSQVGWYDYMYGVFFFVPRVFPQEMQKSFLYAAENSVYGHYIEMYHNIGDGPKAYIAAKLLWDPYQDVDALMEEWYELTVGAEAAEDLAAFYELWEQFWTVDIKDTDWFENSKWNTYLPINNAGYMSDIPKSYMEESRQLIDSVVAKAQTEEQQIRAEKFAKMFEYYEASVNSYPVEGELPEDEASALDLLERVVQSTQLGQYRYDLIEEFQADPALRFGTRPRVDWTGGNGKEFWGMIDYIQANEPAGGAVTDEVYRYATESEAQAVRDSAQLMYNIIEGSQPTLTSNASFEEGNGNIASSWTYWNPLQSASITRVEGVARTGNHSILFENAERAGVYQIFEIKPGHSAPAVSYYTPPGTETDGGVRIVITLRNADGRTIGDYISPTIPLSETAGEWASVGLFESIPYEINGEVVTEVLLNAQVWNAQDADVYFDDVVMHQIEAFVELPEDDGILNQNSSFELGAGNNAPPWGYWLSSATTGSIKRVEGVAQTGNASLLIDHLDRGGPIQTVEVPAGDTTFQLSYYTPEDTVTNGTIEIIVNVKNSAGANLVAFRSGAVPLADTVGEWNTISFTEDIPSSVNGVDVANIQVVATIDKAQDALLYIDDFEVFQPEPEVELTNPNSSFEGGDDTAWSWGLWLSSSTTGTMKRVEGVAHTGNASLLVDHLDRGGPTQYVPVSPGEVTLKVSYYTPEGTDTDGTISLGMNVKNAQNGNLVVFSTGPIPLSNTVGEWTTIELTEEVPAEVNGVAMKDIQVVATINQAQDALVYIDDFEVWN